MKTTHSHSASASRHIVLLLLLTNAVFAALYHKFIIGNGVYLYSDIGSDAYTSSYPIISMLADLFQNGSFPQYELTAGLGNNIAVTYLQYLNPLKAFLLLFSKETMPVGLMLYLLLQTNVTSIAGWFFFRSYTEDERAALIPTLIWTFSGYTVLWSQNLSFGVCISMFTLVMLLLRKFLLETRFRTWLLLVGVLALFLVTNYYFFYMTGIFTVCYTVGFMLSHRKPFTDLIRRLFALLAAAVFSFIICAADIAAILSVFFGSVRGEEAVQTESLLLLSPDHLLSTLARLLSPNILGTGDDYTGYSNYYETACLFAGALFFIALVYLLCTKKFRRRTAILLLITSAALATTLTGKLFTLSALGQRYVFLAVFLECLCISDFLSELYRRPDKRALTVSVFIGTLCPVLILLLVRTLGAPYGITVSSRAALFFFAPLFAYDLLLLIQAFRPRPSALIPYLLTLTVCGELLIANYDSVNHRSYITDDIYTYSMYNDGTQTAAEYLASYDTGLYRVSGDSNIAFANAGMVNRFNALSAYSSTLPKSLIRLSKDQNTIEGSRNHFLSDYYDYVQYTLLGGKYLIDDGFHLISQGMEPSLMTEIHQIYEPEHGIDKRILENRNALPFGYLYKKEVTPDSYRDLDADEAMHILTEAYYETDGTGTAQDASSVLTHRDSAEPLLPLITESFQTDAQENGSSVVLTTQGEGGYLIFSSEKKEGESVLQYFHAALDPEYQDQTVTMTIYPLTESESAAKEAYAEFVTLNQDYPEANLMLPDDLIGLRIDITTSPTVLSAFELITCPGIQSSLQGLADTDITDISFEDSTYSAHVSSEDGGMLCVPLIYDDEWQAEVNGEPVRVHNINGGLVGIPLDGGDADITIRYRIRGFDICKVISLLALIVYLALWIFSKGNRHET